MKYKIVKNKKIILSLFMILLILIPCALANNLKNEDEEKPRFFGFIYGQTRGVFEHADWILPFVTLKFGIRRKISGLFGHYIFWFLPLDKTYKITASRRGYDDLTLEVTLSREEPIKRLDFYMAEEWH